MSDSEGFSPDMSALLAQAQQMAEQLGAQQAAAQEAQVEGHAGGGAVKITMTGGGQFLSVDIEPTVVDPDDVEMLEDLVLAALNDAVANAAKLVEAPNLGGLDLNSLGLGGLLGGSD